MNSRRAGYIYILLLCPLIYFAIFLHLDSLPFRVWDEAYLATHTYEMMHDHDYIVTHSFGSPEMSNTKPPLAIWCMVWSCSALGFNELAIRLPNALAGVVICFFVFLFSGLFLKNLFQGFLSVLVLISSTGFIRTHVVRSGEYDAMLMIFVTAYCLSFFLILENHNNSKRKNILWVAFTASFICAILTKGIAAFLIAPGLFLYALYQKSVLKLLRTKELYISVFFIVLIGIGYYLLREHYNHGYIKAVYENELGGRYLNPMIQTSRAFYFDEIFNDQLKNYIPFMLIGLFGSLYSGDIRQRRFAVFCSLILTAFLLIISFSATRLYWYDAPAFPFLALLSGTGIYMVLDYIFRVSEDNVSLRKKSMIALLIILFVAPAYSAIIEADQSLEENQWDAASFNLTHYIELREKAGANLNGYKIVNDCFLWRALFCQVKKWENRGQKMQVINEVESLKPGDKVILSLESAKNDLNRRYNFEIIDSYKNVQAFLITGNKVLQ